MFSRQYIENAPASTTSSTSSMSIEGGAKKKKKTKVIRNFNDLWTNLPIRKLEIFSIRRQDDPTHFDTVVYITKRNRKKRDGDYRPRTTYYAKMHQNTVEDLEKFEASIADLLKNLDRTNVER